MRIGTWELVPSWPPNFGWYVNPIQGLLAVVLASAAKPDMIFQVQPYFGPNFRVQTGRVDFLDPKTGPIGSG